MQASWWDLHAKHGAWHVTAKAKEELCTSFHPPLRDDATPWGLANLTLRQYQQLAFGTEILLFALCFLAILLEVGGFGILEHPDTPTWKPSASSIWNTGFVRWLLQSPAVSKTRFRQDLHGQKSAKPTAMLALRVPTLAERVSKRQVDQGLYDEPADHVQDKSLGVNRPRRARKVEDDGAQSVSAVPLLCARHVDPRYSAGTA